jgi:hypothetical protein
VPVRPEPSAVICGTFVCESEPRKLTVRVVVPVTATSSMLARASSFASRSAFEIGTAIGAVVWPSNVSVNVPPVAPETETVWFSFVSMSLNGEKPPELPPPAGVSSPVTIQRLSCESNRISPAT